MCTIFLQTSLTTPLRIRIWLSLLFLYHICLYNAHKIKCAGQGHLSSAASPSTTFLVLSDTAKLANASLILWLHIFAHFIMFSCENFFILPDPSQFTCTLWDSLIFPFSYVCLGQAGKCTCVSSYSIILLTIHYFFNVRNFVLIWSLFGMNLYKVSNQILHFLDLSVREKCQVFN